MFQSIRQPLGVLVDMAKTRAELAVTELEEERLRLAELMQAACLAMFLWVMTVIMSSLFFIVWMGEAHRMEAIGGLALFFGGLGAWSTWRWKCKAASKPRLLEATLTELSLDFEAFRGVSHQEPGHD